MITENTVLWRTLSSSSVEQLMGLSGRVHEMLLNIFEENYAPKGIELSEAKYVKDFKGSLVVLNIKPVSVDGKGFQFAITSSGVLQIKVEKSST